MFWLAGLNEKYCSLASVSSVTFDLHFNCGPGAVCKREEGITSLLIFSQTDGGLWVLYLTTALKTSNKNGGSTVVII